jgi:hypothetical protein
MKTKEKKPATPNAAALTGQQQASNDLNASNNRYFNNTDINGPFGSSTWTRDASGRMTQNVNLDPDQQRALDDQQALSADLSGLARRMVGNVSTDAFGIPAGLPTRTTGLDRTGMKNLNSTDYGGARDEYTRAMFDRTMSLMNPQFEKQNKKAEQFLSDRGIPYIDQGDGAATDYRGSIATQQNEATLRAAQDAVQQGSQEQSRLFGLDQITNDNIINSQTVDAGFRDNSRDKGIEEAYQMYNAPLERIRALFGASPELDMMGPQQFNGFASQGGDIAGNTWNAFNADMDKYKQAQAEKAAMMNAIGGLVGTAGKAAVGFWG